jgi:hypothetical protein
MRLRAWNVSIPLAQNFTFQAMPFYWKNVLRMGGIPRK